MARFFRFLLALALLPLCLALPCVVGRALFIHRATGLSVEAWSFIGGFAFFVILSLVLPAPARLYVFGHELTHALWGLAFGARVSNIKVSARGGSVLLSKSNVWITLAPYFFPFYTLMVVGIALITRLFISPLPLPWIWYAAVGFTWSFHVILTLRALFQTQPDVQEYGRLFSWVFIWIANLVIVVLALVAATPLTWTYAKDVFLQTTAHAYITTYTLAHNLVMTVLALCGNQ